MNDSLAQLAYLVAAVMFILGLKWLASPVTARRGNLVSAIGMLLAIVVTLLDRQIVRYEWIGGGMIVGAALGAWMARAVQMTSMPQMVGLLNGFGGGASALVAAAQWYRWTQVGGDLPAIETRIAICASTLIGGVTIAGSVIAAGKLQGLFPGRAILFPGRHLVNALLGIGALVALVMFVRSPDQPAWFLALNALALLLGVLLVIPIGGADMPVVICLLNSYSGLAASMTGFVIQNHGLIITGALVGASGLILTHIMCVAMNRSLTNVLFGGLGAVAAAPGATDDSGQPRHVKSIQPEDGAALLAYARAVVIVPGYGLAVAQAQHQARELSDLLLDRGIDVKYGIHPVAGRMPGHMNVLLAEANVPYDQLYDMDTVNPQMERTDVVLVVGANDVVNPAARTQPDSPLYGMPILEVDRARQVIFMKRSLNPGFAGVANELFFAEQTSMLFGDARESLTALIAEINEL